MTRTPPSWLRSRRGVTVVTDTATVTPATVTADAGDATLAVTTAHRHHRHSVTPDSVTTVTPPAVTRHGDATATRTVTSDADANRAVTPHPNRHRDAATVIDNTDVRRDWRHHATTAAAVTFVADNTAAVYLAALNLHPHAVWTLTALSPALALTLTALTHHTRQAGRRLTWANPR